MGNSYSQSKDKNIFQAELSKLNTIVNDIISDKDLFKDQNYNFLSEDVCSKYHVILQEELEKHLKLDITDLGAKLYIIPKEDDEKLTKYKLTKQQVCGKISNHYIKLLYVMCLIKYVYNLEHHGDLSISGIIFRNIKIVDDMMEIHFCGLPHRKYTNASGDVHKIDFSKLEGMKFFAEYFLNAEESQTFLGILKSILARSTPQKVNNAMCTYINKHGLSDLKHLEDLYALRFNKKLTCQRGGTLDIFIQKDNPVFLSEYCGAPMKIVLKLNTPQGKKVKAYYHQMHERYQTNIQKVHDILSKLVEKKNSQFTLKDIDKRELDKIIHEIKWHIKQFYLQSIMDFQNILDMAKATPNIHLT